MDTVETVERMGRVLADVLSETMEERDRARADVRRLTEERDQLECSAAQGKVGNLRHAVEEAEAERDVAREALAAAQERLGVSRQRVLALDAERDTLKQQVKDVETTLGGRDRRVKALAVQVEGLQAQRDAWAEKEREYDACIEELERERDTARAEAKEWSAQLTALRLSRHPGALSPEESVATGEAPCGERRLRYCVVEVYTEGPERTLDGYALWDRETDTTIKAWRVSETPGMGYEEAHAYADNACARRNEREEEEGRA